MEIAVGCVVKAIWVWSLLQRGLVLDNDCFAPSGYHLQKCVCFDCFEILKAGESALSESILWIGVFPSGDSARLRIADRRKVIDHGIEWSVDF